MDYFASYTITGCFDEKLFIGEDPVDSEQDTIFILAQIFNDCEPDSKPIGAIEIRRVLISRLINERRSISAAMDCVDQWEHDVWYAVFDHKTGYYNDRIKDAGVGDLLIFGDMQLAESAVLRDFNINKILDDIVYHVGDASVVVFPESYADFTHFNAEACEFFSDIGYAKATATIGLAVGRERYLAELRGDTDEDEED
jgi:hypothetical protein